MKVLQINKYHYLKGGADTVFFNTIKLLTETGHQAIPFCIIDNKNLQSEYSKYFVKAEEIRNLKGLKRFLSIPRFFYNRDAAKKLEILIKNEQPDIAHIHNLFNGLSLSILPVLWKHKIPVVITIHDTRFLCPSSYFKLRGKLCANCRKSIFSNCAIHRCYQDSFTISIMSTLEMIHKTFLFNYNKYISKYIFVSNAYLNIHNEYNHHFSDKGMVLYNFVPNLKDIAQSNKKGDYILYYGRITAEKGVSTLVEAVRDLPDIKLKIAGTGPLLDTLKKTASANIEFLGFLSGEKLFNVIRNCSFSIIPSEGLENNPLTIIESYLCGKPVIATRNGGITEIVKEDETGYLFSMKNKEDLKSKIIYCNTITQDKYTHLSLSARKFAEENFNPDIHYNRLMSVYNEAIKNYGNI